MTNSYRYFKWPVLAILALLQLACGNGSVDSFEEAVTLATPDKYLTFFNRQAELAAGSYTLIVATAISGQSGSFSVLVKRNNGGSEQLLSGSWSNSAGPSATPATTCSGASANVCFNIDMQDAKGASFELTTSLDGILYLVDDSNTAQTVGTANANGVITSGVSETLNYSESIIDESDFATAYYTAIDPGNARDTFQKFRSLHGFDTAGEDVHVTFRDSKDLGYGRDMYMRSYPNPDCGGQVVAFYVRNFSVDIIDGFAYGPVNLEAAIEDDLQFHFGSNAIEFSRGLSSAGDVCSPEPMAKFYTYKSDYSSSNAPHPRLLRIDLDARGEKAMPQPCVSCHGGKLRPLDRFGRMVAMHAEDPVAQIGDTKARLQAFEVDTFEFSDESGKTQSDFEDGIRQLNAAVYCTYPGSAGHAACASHGGGFAAQTNVGEWSGDFGREMLLGWYNNRLEVAGTDYDEDYVPVGWRPTPGGVPGGADALFKKVIGPNCFVCHGKRGSELGSDTNASGEGKDLDFSSWEKFISHAEEIVELVYREGRMPLGLLNYSNFWDDPEKAELLGSFLSPFVDDFETSYVDDDGDIILPGRVVARAGPDRVTLPNAVITLNAQASLFADSYTWTLLSSPSGASAVIASPTSMRTDFNADTDGEYILQLDASSSETDSSSSDEITAIVDSTLPKAPRDLSFYTDISTELVNCMTSCHENGGVAGIPMWWVDDASQPQGVPASMVDTPSLGLYEHARARINLEYPEDSLMLKKPIGRHHYGGQRIGFDATQGVGNGARTTYDLFVNWISEGAVCGGTNAQCPQ